MFKYIILLTMTILANVDISKPILNAINFERSKFRENRLSPVVYNYDMQNELELYPMTNGDGWCLQNNTNNWALQYPLVGNLNKVRLDNCVFLMNYATFERENREGYKFLFSYNTDKKLKDILTKGKKCYDLQYCSKTNYTNYISCTKKTDKCNGCNVYYPRIVEQKLTQISCFKDADTNYCFGKNLLYDNDYPTS